MGNRYANVNKEFPGLDGPTRDSLSNRLQRVANRNGAVLLRENSEWHLWHPGEEDRVAGSLREMAEIIMGLLSKKIFI